MQALNQADAVFRLILAALNGMAQRAVTPGDEALYQCFLNAERRRALRRVQNAKSSGGSRSDI